MPELTPKDRLQPSLLDRLTDDAPEERTEARDKRVLSMEELRKCVMRDIAWLFNAGNLASVQDLSAHPLVAESVVNYGLADLAGATASGLDRAALERMVRQAIWSFEPRILRNTVKVQAFMSEELMNRNALAFVIEGDLWGEPLPQHLYLRTEIDLETGNVALSETAPGG
ncbi:MAG: type VI secretion system baseplate subunit TssE [Kiloniellales bacterium]|nr:type VI secretion system baseplate subunit TssE [Kiloniellales bacterium]